MSSTATSPSALEASVATLTAKLTSLIQSLESHPLFTLSPAPKSLTYTHDFIMHTRHLLSQISLPSLAAKDKAATEAYWDVTGRCIMAQMIVCDESGTTARMMTMGQEPVDFGSEARERAEEVVAAAKNDLG